MILTSQNFFPVNPPLSYSVEKRRDHRNLPYATQNYVGVRQISVIPPLLNTITQGGGGGGGGGGFGLVNVLSTFQHLMDQLLEGTQIYAAAYLDDVIIHSRCWEEHLEHLREILTRLRNTGLTIMESKCKFTCNECEYLGHTVGNGKVHPLQAKVQAIQDFTHPNTEKDVCAFFVYVSIIAISFKTFPLLQPP